MADNPVEYLFSTLEAVKQNGDPDLVQWYESGIEKFLEGCSLDESLLLKPGPGQRSARTKFLMMKRDGYLRAAHASCEGDSKWQKAVELERQINIFESTIWPRVREEEFPPARLSQLRRNLFLAKKVGLALPEKARQLHEIATGNIFTKL